MVLECFLLTEFLPGTCQVAITAATTITLNWRQIRTALDTLLNVCVNTPFYTAGEGGRAYYGAQPAVTRRSRWRKRQDDDQLSGK